MFPICGRLYSEIPFLILHQNHYTLHVILGLTYLVNSPPIEYSDSYNVLSSVTGWQGRCDNSEGWKDTN